MKIILTKDHSATLLNETLGVPYHSLHGAWQESQHVFIQNGLHAVLPQKNQIHLLEIGLGTGLNALLSYQEAQKFSEKKIFYTAIEKFPIDASIVKALATHFPFNENKELFYALHSNKNKQTLSPHFQFHTILNDVSEAIHTIPKESIDLIYYDAFAPSTQPNMWQPPLLNEIYNTMKKGAVLVTFCAQGEFKRTLKKIGFKVEALPGAHGKREMTRAIKL